MTIRGLTTAFLGLHAMMALVPTTSEAQAPASTASTAAPPVTIPRTELRHLKSAIVGETYQLRVWFPESYATSGNRHPVIYLLDGDLTFGMTTDIAQYLIWGNQMPEVIIAAPAYGGIHGPERGGPNMRTRDLSVFRSQGRYVEGGGTKFLRFLREELIPYVERELRADSSDRTLVGFSRGADFTVYTLLTAPETFRRYVSIESFQPEYLVFEDSLAQRRKDLPVELFISTRYPNSGVQAFVDKLKSRKYPGLDVEYALSHPRHFAAAGDGITKGLISVFNRASVYDRLLPIAAERGAAAAITEYRRLKRDEERAYNFAESELVELGNALAIMQRPADAVTVYRLNLEFYPQSASTFSRLGTAQERLGQKQQALESFRRALQLNPNDRFAADAIKRLESR